MKSIFVSLIIMLFVIGCGYKSDPKYDNKTTQEVKRQ